MKNNKSIYKRKFFFYKGALVIRASIVVDKMMKISKTDSKKRIEACTFLPGIFFVDNSKNFTHYLCNHEAIHVRQIWECIMLSASVIAATDLSLCIGIPFALISYWLLYLLEFIILRTLFGHHNGYLLLSFEQEAWLNEADREYLKIRKRIPFIWVLIMIKNIFLLSFRRYRIPLFRRLVHIRTSRKQYYYWKIKINQ